MTTKTQDAPGQTGQDLNDPQPDIYDAPGQTVAYAIYHPDQGFAATCTSAIEDFTDHQNVGSAILLYRQQDVAVADRLQRGWSDKATIIPVRIPEPRRQIGIAVPSQLFALRRPDGIWKSWPCHDTEAGEALHQVLCFRTADEAAAERHFDSEPDLEIVPLVEARFVGGEHFLESDWTYKPTNDKPSGFFLVHRDGHSIAVYQGKTPGAIEIHVTPKQGSDWDFKEVANRAAVAVDIAGGTK